MEKLRNLDFGSKIKRRRAAVSAAVHPHGVRVYDHLSRRSNNLQWRYLCCLSYGIAGTDEYWDVIKYFRPDVHNENHEDAQRLRDGGAGKMFFAFPWFALVEHRGIVLARFVFEHRLFFVYDIHKDEIILKR